MNSKFDEFFKNMLTIGTPQCAVFLGLTALVLAVLFLTVGFWGTLFIALLMALGVFIGAVKDKKAAVRAFINRVFPPRDNTIGKDGDDEHND